MRNRQVCRPPMLGQGSVHHNWAAPEPAPPWECRAALDGARPQRKLSQQLPGNVLRSHTVVDRRLARAPQRNTQEVSRDRSVPVKRLPATSTVMICGLVIAASCG